MKPRRYWSGKKGAGEGIAWLHANAGHASDSCLCWPLFCDDKGYGIVSINRRPRKAHRVMCEIIHGPAPTASHEAAHSCGRGHKGCVNPRHLLWKTRSENQRDRRKHGTAGKPGVAGRSKMTPEQIEQIRAIGRTMTQKELGKRFNCSPTNISKIQNGHRWVTTPPWLRAGLTSKDLEDIRASKGLVHAERLADIYSVSRSVIWRIQNLASTYKHLGVIDGESTLPAKEG